MASIRYKSGDHQLLDQIQPLWEQLNLHHAQVSPHFDDDFHQYDFATRKAKLLQKYADGEIRVDIAQFEGCNVGYLISGVTIDRNGEIESISIAEDFRGQAIGDQLMRRALAWLDEQNVHTKIVDVAFGNERAYSFYARFGFYPRVVKLNQKGAS